MNSEKEDVANGVANRRSRIGRQLLHIFLFNCLVVIILLLFCESASQVITYFTFVRYPNEREAYVVADSKLGWTLAPHFIFHDVVSFSDMPVTYRIDEHFRLDKQEVTQPEHSDVIIIGDSHAFGYYVQEEETLSCRLYNVLKEQKKPCIVLNAGVPGYGPVQYLLRLQSLGKLKKNSLVVVYFNPLNDLVNLSTEVHYGRSKPTIELVGRMAVTKPLIYDPSLNMRFSTEFAFLNRLFRVRQPAPPPLIAQLARYSATAGLLWGLKWGRVQSVWTETEMTTTSDEKLDVQSFVKQRQETFRKGAWAYTKNFWPVVQEFSAEAETLERMLTAVFAKMQRYVNKFDADLLIVMSQECYRNQAYWKGLTDILEQQSAQYHFDWILPRKIVLNSARNSGVEILEITYPEERIEDMYVPYDGHTSGNGFIEVARQIESRMDKSAGSVADNVEGSEGD